MSFERVYGVGWLLDFTVDFLEHLRTISQHLLIGLYTDQNNIVTPQQIQYLKAYADHIFMIPYRSRGLYLSAMIRPRDTVKNACLFTLSSSFKCCHICVQTWNASQKLLTNMTPNNPERSSLISPKNSPAPALQNTPKDNNDSEEMKRKSPLNNIDANPLAKKTLVDEDEPVTTAFEDLKTKKIKHVPKPCYLSQKYPHPRDHSIRFEDEYEGLEHVYLVDWSGKNKFEIGGNISVSALYKRYFPEFNADQVIAKMMAGNNWEKSKYYGMSVAEIKAQWDKAGSDASKQGSAHHLKCEQYYNGIPLSEPYDKPTEQFLQFAADHKKLKPFRTEWLLHSDEDQRVCGTPDMVFFSPYAYDTTENSEKTLYLTIFDWKNSKKIKKYNMWEKGFPPFEDLPNCNYFHYAIQLNIYKYMLETFYAPMEVDGITYNKIEVDKMFLIVMHENREKYLKLLLPNYQERVKKIFDIRAEEIKQNKSSS